jgi:hypothetical protein
MTIEIDVLSRDMEGDEVVEEELKPRRSRKG